MFALTRRPFSRALAATAVAAAALGAGAVALSPTAAALPESHCWIHNDNIGPHTARLPAFGNCTGDPRPRVFEFWVRQGNSYQLCIGPGEDRRLPNASTYAWVNPGQREAGGPAVYC